MENKATLQSKIELIEDELEVKYRDEFQTRENRLDFSKGGWTDEMKQIVIDFRKKIEPELHYIRGIVLEALQEKKFSNIPEVGALLESTKRLKNHIVPALDELSNSDALSLALALFVMQDLKPDARDAILYFADLMKRCKTKKIDIKPILEQLLPYTSTGIQFGEYSMRILFQQAIDQSVPTRKLKK
jgi:hypothetical protein